MDKLTSIIQDRHTSVSKRLDTLEKYINEKLGEDGYTLKISLQHAKDKRQVRADSKQAYSPEEVVISIGFLPVSTAPPKEHVFVEELRAASASRDFVSLTWFRDKHLPRQRPDIFPSSNASRETLNELLGKGVVLTSYIPNPDPEKPRTTTLLLNYQHSEVKELLSGEARERGRTYQPSGSFQPLSIKGGPLAETVLSDRR